MCQPEIESEIPFVVQTRPAGVVIVGNAVFRLDLRVNARDVALVELVGIEYLPSGAAPAAAQPNLRNDLDLGEEGLRGNVPRRRNPRIERRVVKAVIVTERIVAAQTRVDRVAFVVRVAG